MWRSFYIACISGKGKTGGSQMENALTKDQLKNFAISQLTTACAGEMLILIRRFPTSKEVQHTPSKNREHNTHI